MAVRDLDEDAIKLMNLFERCTHTQARDCVTNSTVYFIVEEGRVGAAIGRGGTNVKKLQKMLKKRVRVFEYNANVAEFVKNMIPEVESVDVDGSRVSVTINAQTRGRVIGRGGENIKTIREILRRNSGVDELEVK